MHTAGISFVFEDALKDRAEDRGADLAPIEALGHLTQNNFERLAVKLRYLDILIFEESAVDVRKISEVDIEV